MIWEISKNDLRNESKLFEKWVKMIWEMSQKMFSSFMYIVFD